MSAPAAQERGPRWLLLIGLPIGFVSSLCGIGGGLFASSFLHFVLGMDLKRATGTGLVLVLATTGAATLTESFQPGGGSAIHWGVTACLVLGVWIGAKLGFVISERVSERLLRGIFAVVLLLSAAKMLLGGASAETLVESGFEPSWPQALWALLIGVGGGCASPVLGVGGGLVMVPGLFLGLPGFGFDAARACSLAAGVVGSSRSLVLKHKAGRVSMSHGLWLAGGSLVGASLGVLSLGIHEGLLNYGRQGIGILLGLVGLRFVRELCSPKAAAGQ